MTPIEILKRIAYQWSIMNQAERRRYYEKCGIHIDWLRSSKIKKLQKLDINSNSHTSFSDNSKEMISDRSGTHIQDEVVINRSDGDLEMKPSDEDDNIVNTSNRKKGAKRIRGAKSGSMGAPQRVDADDGYIPPKRGRGGRRRRY